ncbi:MAG: site-specific integrase, partial [Thermoanaerobaculia bacterium]
AAGLGDPEAAALGVLNQEEEVLLADEERLDFLPHRWTPVGGGNPMPHLSPPTLTASEQKSILRAAAGHPRDHLIYSLALGTGLRLAEIVGLNVGDVFAPDGTPRSRVRVRPEIAKGGRSGDVFLPDALVTKLKKFWAHTGRRGEGIEPGDPLFCSQSRVRISKRRVQFAWREWQQKAGFDRLYPFHGLRHTSVTNVYRKTRDLFLAQRFARHVSPLTTTIYTHPSDEELFERLRGMPC